MRFTETLVLNRQDREHVVACRHCGHALVKAGTPWKPFAVLLQRRPSEVHELYTTGADVVIRNFFCPTCSALLDTETALEDDPFLNDVIFAQADE